METVRSLNRFPGGKVGQLDAITSMLQWIDSQKHGADRKLFAQFVAGTFSTQTTTGASYLASLVRLKLIVYGPRKMLVVTALGKDFINSQTDEQRSRLLIPILLAIYDGFRELLELFGEHETLELEHMFNAQITQEFELTESAITERIAWLMNVRCISQPSAARRYRLTPFGRSILTERNDVASSQMSPSIYNPDDLVEELRLAAKDSKRYQRFEELIGQAFRILGYEYVGIGGSGEPDGIATAGLGPRRYRVCIEARTSNSGAIDTLNGYAISQHKSKHACDYAVLVAPGFKGKQIHDEARTREITLLPIDVLCEWLIRHTKIPLSVGVYRSIFSTAGLISLLPPELADAYNERERHLYILRTIFAAFRVSSQVAGTIPDASTLTLALNIHGIAIEIAETETALNWLAHPYIRSGYRSTQDFLAQFTSLQELANSLREFAAVLERDNTA